MDDVDDIFDLYRQGKISDKELEKKLSWKEFKKQMDEKVQESKQKIEKEMQEDIAAKKVKNNAKLKEQTKRSRERFVRSSQNILNRAFLGLDKYGDPIHPRYRKNKGKNYPLPKSITDLLEE